MAEYVKLGEKASMFYDPTTKVKVIPGMAVEISNRQRQSKKYKRAVAAGHLDKISENDADEMNAAYAAKRTKGAKKTSKPAETDITKMNKKELVAYAVAQSFGTIEEMDDMNKKDLLAYIQDELEDTIDDEDDDEDDDDEDDA